MTSFQKAVKSAFQVFSRRNVTPVTHDSLGEIMNNLNNVTKSELRLDPILLEDKIPAEHEPPVTYIKILEDQVSSF